MMKSGEEFPSLLLMGILVHIYLHSSQCVTKHPRQWYFTLLHTRFSLRDPEQHHCRVTAAECSRFCNPVAEDTTMGLLCLGKCTQNCCAVATSHTPQLGALPLTSRAFHWRFGNQVKATFSLYASLQLIICPRPFLHALLAKCIHRLNPSCLWSFF